DRVLDRDARLVVVAVEDPLLELELRQLPLVHQHVIAVMIVVAMLALAAQPVDELLTRQGRSHLGAAHRATSMPSSATSQPAADTAARSAESSRSMGLVLLMWM